MMVIAESNLEESSKKLSKKGELKELWVLNKIQADTTKEKRKLLTQELPQLKLSDFHFLLYISSSNYKIVHLL